VRVNDALPQISQLANLFGSVLARKPRPVGGELHKEFLQFLEAREAFMRGLIKRLAKAETEGMMTT
jgi:hypothetical protein